MGPEQVIQVDDTPLFVDLTAETQHDAQPAYLPTQGTPANPQSAQSPPTGRGAPLTTVHQTTEAGAATPTPELDAPTGHHQAAPAPVPTDAGVPIGHQGVGIPTPDARAPIGQPALGIPSADPEFMGPPGVQHCQGDVQQPTAPAQDQHIAYQSGEYTARMLRGGCGGDTGCDSGGALLAPDWLDFSSLTPSPGPESPPDPGPADLHTHPRVSDPLAHGSPGRRHEVPSGPSLPQEVILSIVDHAYAAASRSAPGGGVQLYAEFLRLATPHVDTIVARRLARNHL